MGLMCGINVCVFCLKSCFRLEVCGQSHLVLYELYLSDDELHLKSCSLLQKCIFRPQRLTLREKPESINRAPQLRIIQDVTPPRMLRQSFS